MRDHVLVFLLVLKQIIYYRKREVVTLSPRHMNLRHNRVNNNCLFSSAPNLR